MITTTNEGNIDSPSNLTLESGEISYPTWATEGEFVSPII